MRWPKAIFSPNISFWLHQVFVVRGIFAVGSLIVAQGLSSCDTWASLSHGMWISPVAQGWGIRLQFAPESERCPGGRKWPPIPVLLPGVSCGWRSPAGYCFWGHKSNGHDWATKQQCAILVPQPEIKPMSPALDGRFLTTGPQGKSQPNSYFERKVFGWYCIYKPSGIADGILSRLCYHSQLTKGRVQACVRNKASCARLGSEFAAGLRWTCLLWPFPSIQLSSDNQCVR